MRILVMILGLVFFSSGLKAQQISLSEEGKDLPLEGVLVFGSKVGNSATSDKNGQVSFIPFENEELIHFQLFGYQSLSISPEEIRALNFLIELSPSLIQMEQAIVSANRWRQNNLDIASKVSLLSSENLMIRNPANTADWLGSSGEVFIQKSQQGGGSPMIRGFSANRLLYAVDGVRMNTAIFRSGNLHNVISIDPFSLASTEILFGPGSVMYGSDAIGGVMSFETLSPVFSTENNSWSGNMATRFASANSEVSLHADIRYSSEKWALLTSFSRFDYGDLKMGSFGPSDYLRPKFAKSVNGVDTEILNDNPENQVQSGYNQSNFMQKIRFKASENTTFSYGFHYSRSSDIPRYDRLIEEEEGKLKNAVWTYGPQVWLMNNFGIEKRSSSRFFNQMNLKVAQQYFEESRISRRFESSNLSTRTEKVNAFSVNADFVKNIKKESFLSYGFEWIFNRVNSDGIKENTNTGIISPTSSRYPNSDWNSLAAYGTYHAHLSERVRLQTGIRYNFISLNADFTNNIDFFPLPFNTAKSDFGAFTGSFGLIINPNPSISISPVFSTGFRAPNVDDIGKIFDSEPGSLLVPNPDLKAEYAYNSEVNVNIRLHKRVKIDFTGFYTLLDNAMVRRPFAFDGEDQIIYDGELSEVLAIQNAASAKVYGLQAGVEISLSQSLLLTSRYNWQKGTEELNDESESPSRHAAPAFGITRLTYAKNNWRLELSGQYSAKVSAEKLPIEEQAKPHLYAKDDQDLPYSPSWWTVNLMGTYQILPFLELSTGIENIGNQRYRPYSSGLSATGRNFTFSLKGSF